jgi:hypothetical protein
MEPKGFFQSLFDYSFSSFITTKLIKVLYILSTIAIAIYTLVLVLVLFKASPAAGIFGLLILGPLAFVIGMIYMRVILELLIVVFRIHEDVREINVRGGGTMTPDVPLLAAEPAGPAPTPVEPPPAPPAAPANEPTDEALAPTKLFCKNCGAEIAAGNSFCTSCGTPVG